MAGPQWPEDARCEVKRTYRACRTQSPLDAFLGLFQRLARWKGLGSENKRFTPT